jgi:hypothetical protein
MINNQFNDLKNHLGANKLQAPFDIIETTCPLCEADGYRIGVVNDVLTAQCPVNGCENSDVFKILFEDRSCEGDLNGFRFDETILNNPPAENDPRLYKYLWRKTLPLEGSPCARVLEQKWGLDPLSFSRSAFLSAPNGKRVSLCRSFQVEPEFLYPCLKRDTATYLYGIIE